MMDKRFAGRDEPILEPDLPIIDAHHHLLARPGFRYLLDDFAADANAGHNIVASIYLEILSYIRTDGPEHLRPLGELEFANGVGAMAASGEFGKCRVAASIVGFADMRLGDSVAELFDQSMQRAPERFRGVRQVVFDYPDDSAYRHATIRVPQGVLHHPQFRNAFRHLGPRGLSFDASVFSVQLADVMQLADAFPDTSIVLNHAGIAMGLDKSDSERSELRRKLLVDLAELARRPNVTCKIGGLGMPYWGFGMNEEATDRVFGYRALAEVWAPYVEGCIAAFGPQRCMMESNFPVDGRTCGYVPLWNALKFIVRNYSADEKAALFHRTAKRVYRLDLPDSLFA
jgi:L-fuconolactonase